MPNRIGPVTRLRRLLRRRKQPNNELHGPDGGATPADRHQPVRPPEPTPPQGWHPQEEHHRRHEGWYWLASIFLSLAIAIGAGLSARYAYRAASEAHEQAMQARRQADIARDTLVASNRPWVMLTDINPVSLSSDDGAGVHFWVKVSVKNVGHSPAQNVSISGRLLIGDFDPPPNEAMVTVCREPQSSSFIIPGRVLFPDQAQNIYGDTPSSFGIEADRVWAARAARIKSTYDMKMAFGNAERAQAWANELAKFPFYAPLNFVGCINYRSADNTTLYQTSFMFDVSTRPARKSFPLLGGIPPVIRYPEPEPGEPDTVMVFPREMQRLIPGDQIKLGTPLYGTFAK